MNRFESKAAAVAELTAALTRLDVIEPAELRGPVGLVLRAAVEVCTRRPGPSTLGLPIRHALDIAAALGAATPAIPTTESVYFAVDGGAAVLRCAQHAGWRPMVMADSLPQVVEQVEEHLRDAHRAARR